LPALTIREDWGQTPPRIPDPLFEFQIGAVMDADSFRPQDRYAVLDDLNNLTREAVAECTDGRG